MTTETKTFANAADIVKDAVARSVKKADIADNVINALDDNLALAPWPGETFTVWLTPDAQRLMPTRTEDLAGGIEVDYWGETPIAYRFPGGAEVEVTA